MRKEAFTQVSWGWCFEGAVRWTLQVSCKDEGARHLLPDRGVKEVMSASMLTSAGMEASAVASKLSTSLSYIILRERERERESVAVSHWDTKEGRAAQVSGELASCCLVQESGEEVWSARSHTISNNKWLQILLTPNFAIL
ncbi:hypothetical protein E2C01_030041 [Portunus trituberculatus]|uniref:Uncharacterized protein n=1 Tax=Portunus trituberculatus TaxID=210409 RepID=A0A5B7EU38_PORTR|nr:hypothetical protein [Portunus trituberculatus]